MFRQIQQTIFPDLYTYVIEFSKGFFLNLLTADFFFIHIGHEQIFRRQN
jgi:hypothetical protein